MISEEVVHQRAEEFIREHAQDVEWLTICESMEYSGWPEIENFTMEEEDSYAHRIDKAISKAKITITWE